MVEHYTVKEVCNKLRISRSKFDKLLHEGEIGAVMIGRSYIIPKDEVKALIKRCVHQDYRHNRKKIAPERYNREYDRPDIDWNAAFELTHRAVVEKWVGADWFGHVIFGAYKGATVRDIAKMHGVSYQAVRNGCQKVIRRAASLGYNAADLYNSLLQHPRKAA